MDRNLHGRFIKDLDARIKRLDYWQGDYLRINGIYWALAALMLLRPELEPGAQEFERASPLSVSEILDFVFNCQVPSGGFGGNVGHDAHLLFTLSAIQILIMLRSLDDPRLDKEATVNYIAARQLRDGSFTGDASGEVDNRFSYCAISALRLLDRMDAINKDRAVDFIRKCKNSDGGYGAIPGGESHSGQVFCCVGALKILGLEDDNPDQLAEWLAWRQLPGGGLNGRPEKLQDVCYSWWVLSALSCLSRLEWIDGTALRSFILACQDPVSGGFSDRPGDIADIFHTLFGIAGLSLLGDETLGAVDARFCLPAKYVQHL